jgi:flavin-binding protein dodecin
MKKGKLFSLVKLMRINIYIISHLFKCFVMPIVKIIEVIASSDKGIDDAIQNAVTEVSKTVHNIDSVFVKDIKAHVQNGKITTYGVICKVSFRVDAQQS